MRGSRPRSQAGTRWRSCSGLVLGCSWLLWAGLGSSELLRDALGCSGDIRSYLKTLQISQIPKDNLKDLKDIPDNVKNGLEIIPVSHVTEVLKLALQDQVSPLSSDDVELATKEASEMTGTATGDITH